MKEINELNLPTDLGYAENHEWARLDNGKVRVGLSDYAQDQLGDIVYVEVPEVGASFMKDEEFGTLESVKAVVELYTPIGGEVIAINESLEDSPELINESPYDDGWIIEIKPIDPGEMDQLLTKDAYLKTFEGLE